MSNEFLRALEKAIDEIELPAGTKLYFYYDFDLCLYCFRIEQHWCYKKVWIYPWYKFNQQLLSIDTIIKDIKHEIKKGITIKIGI